MPGAVLKICTSLDFLYPTVYHSKRIRTTKTPTQGSAFVTIASEERLGFIKSLQTLGTDIQFASLTIHHDRALGNVRPELAIGAPLGKANIMPKLRTFAAHFTLCH